MEELQKKIKEKISNIKTEIKSITDQIETYRKDGDEGDVGVNTELQDKLEILSEKIFQLKKNLGIYSFALKSSDIRVGKTVEITNQSKLLKKLTVVLPEDADPQQGLISCDSPIGQALLNKREGESVVFASPNGSQEFKISNVL